MKPTKEEIEQAQKELEKVNEATKQIAFTENVLEAIKTIEDDYDDILDWSDNSITVSIKMHGITNSVSIQDDDCTIYKMASLFNSVLLGSGYSQKVISQVLKNFEK
jgi:hypothetical protein